MRKAPLKIGDIILGHTFSVLAPLAGITDISMRLLCMKQGASLAFTEMVSAKGLWYGDRKTEILLRDRGGGRLCGISDIRERPQR